MNWFTSGFLLRFRPTMGFCHFIQPDIFFDRKTRNAVQLFHKLNSREFWTSFGRTFTDRKTWILINIQMLTNIAASQQHATKPETAADYSSIKRQIVKWNSINKKFYLDGTHRAEDCRNRSTKPVKSCRRNRRWEEGKASIQARKYDVTTGLMGRVVTNQGEVLF